MNKDEDGCRRTRGRSGSTAELSSAPSPKVRKKESKRTKSGSIWQPWLKSGCLTITASVLLNNLTQ